MARRRKYAPVFDALAHPLALLLVAAVVVVVFVWSSSPPAARGSEAEEVEFSAIRAQRILRDLLRESEPHVVGSEQNRVVRDRIVSHLKTFGYRPQIQSRFHCNADFASCATIENIIAEKPGSDPRKAVLVTAHYDSSWAGPGAADDGAGVASVLEIARMAADYGEMLNDIIFLFTDGEEQGLIGADAFAEHHPLFRRVAVVINLEARGVTGPSVMFETGEGNRSIIRILSKNLRRPVANSLAYEIYKRMPNDTDFSVYRKTGLIGLNFAFTGGVALYHSRLDDVAHLDPGSLQHHGENAWSMVKALVDRNINGLSSREDAAYIDVFGRLLWHYPESIATGVTLLLSVLAVLGISLYFPRDIGFVPLAWALLAQVCVIALILAGTWLLHWPLGTWIDTHPIEHPSPWIGRLSLLAMCLVAIWFGCKFFAHRVPFGAAILVCWALFAVLAFWLGFRFPTASFVALLPLCAFLLGMLLDVLIRRTRARLTWANVFGVAVASYIAIYHFLALDVVVPFTLSHVKSVPLLLMVLPLLPAWFGHYDERIPNWRPGILLCGLVIATALLHQLVPGFSEARPRGVNLVYREVSGEPGALVILESSGGNADADYVTTHGFERAPVPAPWSGPTVSAFEDRPTVERYVLEMPASGLPGTQVRVLGSVPADDASGTWHQLELAVPSATEQVVVAFDDPAQILQARVEGVTAMDPTTEQIKGDRPRLLRITYPTSDPIRIDLKTEADDPFTMALTARRAIPDGIRSKLSSGWPATSQPVFRGFRAEIVTEVDVKTGSDRGE